MVVVKGLSTVKSRVSGGRDTRKSGTGGVRSLKVYEETKMKSIPVKAETSHVHAISHKVDVNKLEKIHGKNINSAQTKVGRKVLADISNSRGNIQKNETFDGSRPGKSKLEKMVCPQRVSVSTRARTASSSAKLSMKQIPGSLGNQPLSSFLLQEGTHVGSQTEAVNGRHTLGRVGNKDLKVFNGNPRTRLQGQETVGDATRKSARNYNPPQRKSFPVTKHVNKADTCDLKKGSLENKVKNKEKCGFSVKPKVGTKVLPPISNARDYRWKNRARDGCINMVSVGHQPTGDAQRLSRRSMKPTVKTTIGIPRAQRVSKSTSFSRKSTFGASSSSKKKEATSRSSFSKHAESVTCEQQPAEGVPSACNSNLVASTSNVPAKGKSGRRKSYTSLLIASSTMLKENGNVTKQEILPDIYDDCNHLEVAEYIDEIYQHYWVTEAHIQPLKNYMDIQTEITPQMRGILINWLIEVHLKFDLMQETLYLMVTLLDCYLSVVTIKKSEMQLVGLTALLLASKYEDFWHPKVMELISISAEVYTRDQMLGMETTILRKLNFRLNLPTPYVFMLRFLRAAQGGKKFENLAFFLIELCLVEYDTLHFKPSLLCASAIYVARCTLHLTPAWTPLLCKHSHYQEFQIRDCAEMILRFHQAARTAVLKAHIQPLKNYMDIQTEITPQMRGILINWLIEVHLKFDLMQETLYLMVTLLDCYLSVVTIKKSEMQLVGLTALLLASKYEDFWHPKVMELISISAEVYTRDQMLGMETTILRKLNFRLNLPTPYVFMLRFLRAAQGGKKFENLAFFLIELCLVEYDTLHFKPSLLCASAIYVARCTLHLTPAWTPLLCKHSHYQEFQIRDCAEMILRFHQAARTAVLKVTYDKYMGADNCRVATIRPLDKLPTPKSFNQETNT